MRIRKDFLGRKPQGGLREHEDVSVEELGSRLGRGQPLFEYIQGGDVVRPCWDVDSYVPGGVNMEEHAEEVRRVAGDAIRRQLDRWGEQVMREGRLDLAVASRHGEVEGKNKVSFRFYLNGARITWKDMSSIISRCNPKEVCFSKSGGSIPLFDDIYSSERHLGIVMCPKTLTDTRVLELETDHGYEDFLAQNVDPAWPMLEIPVVQAEEIASMVGSETWTAPTETTVNAAPMGISRETAARLLKLIKNETLAAYQDWLRIGMACHANVTESLWEPYNERCRTAPGYDYHKNLATWNGFRADRSITVRTLFFYAKRDDPAEYRSVMHDLRILNINSVAEAFQTYGSTEAALAASSAALFPRFRYTGSRWYEFRSPRWIQIKEGAIRRHLMDEVQPAWARSTGTITANAGDVEDPDARKRMLDTASAMLKLAHTLFTKGGKDRVEAELRVLCLDDGFEERLNSNPSLFAFEDCVWDWNLSDGRGDVRPGRPEDHISFSCGYPFPQAALTDAEMSVLKRFLDTIYPHEDVQRFVLGMVRRCLDGRIPQCDHNVFLLTGVGGNGKSKMMAFVDRLLGEYVSKPPITMFCQKRVNHTAADMPMLALRGRRFVYASEPDPGFGDRLNGSLVKELTGGEPISARTLYEKPVTFRPQFFLALMANENLDLDGRDGGIARRLKVIRHVSRFLRDLPEARPAVHQYPQDDALCAAAEALAPKFLAMLIRSRVEDVCDGVPAKVVEWTEEYLGERNVVKTFLKDMVEPGGERDFVTLSQLRSGINDWAHGVNMVHALKTIKLQVLKAEFEKVMGSCEGERRVGVLKPKNVFMGWKMRSVAEDM